MVEHFGMVSYRDILCSIVLCPLFSPTGPYRAITTLYVLHANMMQQLIHTMTAGIKNHLHQIPCWFDCSWQLRVSMRLCALLGSNRIARSSWCVWTNAPTNLSNATSERRDSTSTSLLTWRPCVFNACHSHYHHITASPMTFDVQLIDLQDHSTGSIQKVQTDNLFYLAHTIFYAIVFSVFDIKVLFVNLTVYCYFMLYVTQYSGNLWLQKQRKH